MRGTWQVCANPPAVIQNNGTTRWVLPVWLERPHRYACKTDLKEPTRASTLVSDDLGGKWKLGGTSHSPKTWYAGILLRAVHPLCRGTRLIRTSSRMRYALASRLWPQADRGRGGDGAHSTP